ncbi:MAG TPA: substrate-binding domain-containing protein [Spirochaetia bacterium]|nr:substrate-binding domain-containing protein [Spirochaetia bacterium]
MLFSEDRLLLFWSNPTKEIPLRPSRLDRYPREDARHWYDEEYAGWGIEKRPMPESPCDGPRGKRIAFLQPGTHPYHVAFAEGLSRIAERAGVRLQTYTAAMTEESQDREVRRAIADRPDLMILVPISSKACTPWVKEMHSQGIPVIVSNYIPEDEAYRYILAWCGPDDWGQFRMLARTFADFIGDEGGYAIIRHIPGSSCHDARTWSVVTELAVKAPRMRCLAMGEACTEGIFDPEAARRLVEMWIATYGRELRGIVSPDDDILVDGINEAIRAAGRPDIVRVGAGSTHKGMQLVKDGGLHAITFQSAQADGALAMKIAADWFEGLDIPPIVYLPKHIITRKNVEDFLSKKPEFSSVSLELLARAVREASEADVDQFFEDAYQSLLSSELMSPEFFRGFCIEVLSTLIHILKTNEVDERAIFGDYESLYRNLFNQKTPRNSMEWMKRLAKDVINILSRQRQAESLVDRTVRYVNRNYAEPLSLKVLSCAFGLSAPYLGRLFHRAVGKSFTTYLNELRLRKADELLRYTSLKTGEIASRIGYANVNYFYTLFKKYKGYYPSESKSKACRDAG